MKIQRDALTGLCILATLAAAHEAMAQEPWVQEGQSRTTVTTTESTGQTSGTDQTADIGAGGSDRLNHYVTPAAKAFELQVGAGYGQGVGDVAASGPTVHDLSGPGGTVQAALGYRFTPHFMFGLYGTGSQFSKGDVLVSGTEVRSATAGLEADFHFHPSYSLDPWLSLSSGMRGLWIAPDTGKNTSLLGLELARAQLGVDFRTSRGLAIAPVVGGDASMFVTRDGPGVSGFTNIGDPRINFFLFGGLQARFDVGGSSPDEGLAHASSGPSVF